VISHAGGGGNTCFSAGNKNYLQGLIIGSVFMESVECIICNSSSRAVFQKESRFGESFTLARCGGCGLEFVSPRPGVDEIGRYYKPEYFTRRTERGYNNYFSDDVRRDIERVFRMNLEDLGFAEFEKSLGEKKRSLDIGCAAGYFVAYMKDRGWEASGIDISKECTDFAAGRGLNVINGDYLKEEYSGGFDLITLWASIEHLHHPGLFLEKISRDLNDGGRLYISTCRTGGLNFKQLFGKKWRFYNFPEHLYFFSFGTMRRILDLYGFRITRMITYGSGVGKSGSPVKKAADLLAKKISLGDMMILSAEKNRVT
jgi:SAM-dependent methyltransferase